MIKAVLTIDDGPSGITHEFMDFLNEHSIVPIMFMLGEQLELFYDNAVYALRHGAIVGNHTYSHSNFDTLTFEACIEEIEKQEAVLDKLYNEAGIERKYKLIRFPFGATGGHNTQKLQEYLKQKGFCKIDDSLIYSKWYRNNGFNKRIDVALTFDFGEWQLQCGNGFTLDTVFEHIHDSDPADGTALLKDNANHILLIHDHDISNQIVPGYYKKIIEHLITQGITFEDPLFMEV